MSKINRPAPAGQSYYTKLLPPKAIAAEWRGGVSEINPDKHGRAFLVSVPLCLCVINLQTKGAKRTAVRDSGLSRPNASPAATPQNNENYGKTAALKSSAAVYNYMKSSMLAGLSGTGGNAATSFLNIGNSMGTSFVIASHSMPKSMPE